VKILVVGQGGREDALAWRLSLDYGTEVFTIPGNAGTERWSKNITNATPEIAAEILKPNLVVIGPESPLANGLGDRLRAKGLLVFGPSQKGAMLEASKVFAKNLMLKYGIPTAPAATAKSFDEAVSIAESREFKPDSETPIVIKVDGLAAGKGVTIARSREEIISSLTTIFIKKSFGESGKQVLIEKFLEGTEASILAVFDGKDFVILPSAEDHKQVFDNDQGPNTGGMGAVSPAHAVTDEVISKVKKEILAPLSEALQKENIDYRGVIYVGLMIKDGRPFVVEFNVRFGDPETQAILPRVAGNLSKGLLCAAEGRLEPVHFGISSVASACVMLASKGYPGNYETGFEIKGLTQNCKIENWNKEICGAEPLVFISGAKREGDRIVASGGRVLSVSGKGKTLSEAIKNAYDGVSMITFEGMHYRKDIGRRKR